MRRKLKRLLVLNSLIAAVGAAGVWATPTATMINPPVTTGTNLPHYAYNAALTLSASAADPGGIAGVSFYASGDPLGNGTSTGGELYTLNVSLLPLSNYSEYSTGEQIVSFYAVATNSSGDQAQSSMASIVIDYPPFLVLPQSLPEGTMNQPYSASVVFDNNYGTVTFSATGLPPGLSMDAGSGAISGVPINAGTFNVTFSMTNIAGTGSGVLPITILGPPPPPPVITSPVNASGQVGQPFQYQTTATQNPTRFAAAGLPTGLSLDMSSGLISGTPVAAGTSTVTLSATNAGGTSNAELTVVIAPGVLPVPSITSPASATGTVGVAFSYQIQATLSPTSFNAVGLPSGLTVNTATGLISGTPVSTGTSTITLSATNDGGTGNAELTVVVSSETLPAPAITSPASAGGTVGVAFSYQIQATFSPTSFNAAGLPSGLTVDTVTGLISGTPAAAGTSTVTLSAVNAGGTGTETLMLTVGPALPAAPVITVAGPATGTVGVSFSYQIQASNSPTLYGATGLPSGLLINTTTGLISGTPTTSGTSVVTLSASNAGGSGSANLTLTIAAAAPAMPVITSPGTAQGTVNQPFSYQVQATNNPTSFNAAGLPSGLFIDAATGLISGTPTTSGAGPVTLSATNAGGTGTATLTLTIAPAVGATLSIGSLPPAVAGGTVTIPVQLNPGTQSIAGLQFDLLIPSGATFLSATEGSAATAAQKSLASNLIGGNDLRVLLAGSNDASIAEGSLANVQLQISPGASGVLPLHFSEVTASNPGGSAVTVTPTDGSLTVQGSTVATTPPAAPVITSAMSAQGTVGQSFSYQIQATNNPTSFNAEGLPPGLSINTDTGLISGTPQGFGTSMVALSASNSTGTGKATLALTIAPGSGLIAFYIRNPASGNVPLTVTFTAQSESNIVSYNWNFGDGSTGSGQQITHTYTTVGTFTSTLTVTDSQGDTATDSVNTVVVNVQPAIVTAGSVSGLPGTYVTFPINYTPSPDINAAGAIEFNLTLPAGISYSSVTVGAALSSAADTLESITAGAGYESFTFYGLSDNIIGPGVLATITLFIDSNVPSGSQPLALFNVNLNDASGTIIIPTTVVQGTLTILSAGTLPAPSLLLPATIPVDQTIGVNYPLGYAVQFDWTVTPLSAAEASSPAGLLLAASPAILPATAVRTLVGPQLNFASLGLAPGRYQIQVVATDSQGNRSAPAVADVTVVSAAQSLSSVTVYPNPWRADRPTSVITFEGLTNNSTVKIFTISAHWVRTLSSSGGSATWDLKNDAGEPVASGLYIYLITDNEGGKIHGKLGIIR